MRNDERWELAEPDEEKHRFPGDDEPASEATDADDEFEDDDEDEDDKDEEDEDELEA